MKRLFSLDFDWYIKGNVNHEKLNGLEKYRGIQECGAKSIRKKHGKLKEVERHLGIQECGPKVGT